MVTTTTPPARRGGWALWLLALLLVAGFSMLSRWQWNKGELKAQRLAEAAQVLDERRAIGLDAALARAAADADPLLPPIDWVVVSGRFADAPAVLLDNQQRDGRAGVRVYRAFLARPGRLATTADGGAAGAGPDLPVLVELGWLPLPPDRRLPEVPLPAGEQVLEGLLAAPPSTGLALGPAAVAAGEGGRLLATRLEPAALADALGLPAALPGRVLRLDPAVPAAALGGVAYARDLDLLPNTLPPEKHRGYAFQWAALASAVLVIALVLGLRRRTSDRTTP